MMNNKIQIGEDICDKKLIEEEFVRMHTFINNLHFTLFNEHCSPEWRKKIYHFIENISCCNKEFNFKVCPRKNT